VRTVFVRRLATVGTRPVWLGSTGGVDVVRLDRSVDTAGGAGVEICGTTTTAVLGSTVEIEGAAGAGGTAATVAVIGGTAGGVTCVLGAPTPKGVSAMAPAAAAGAAWATSDGMPGTMPMVAATW
jgi:hypothetical protein